MSALLDRFWSKVEVRGENECWPSALDALARAEAAEARLAAVEAERDSYREALERIVSPRSGHLQRDAIREVARSALAGVGGVPGDTQHDG